MYIRLMAFLPGQPG